MQPVTITPKIEERLELANEIIRDKLAALPEKIAKLYVPQFLQLQALLEKCHIQHKDTVKDNAPKTGGKRVSPGAEKAVGASANDDVPMNAFPRFTPYWGCGSQP